MTKIKAKVKPPTVPTVKHHELGMKKNIFKAFAFTKKGTRGLSFFQFILL